MEVSLALRNAALGASILGAIGGVIGSFALLRRQSLLGDALAHAALPGVCLAWLVTGSRSPLALLVGAMATCLVGAFAIVAVTRWSRVKEDSAIGISLSVLFGLGIVLLTFIQQQPDGNKSGLDRFLFGQAATLTTADVRLMAILSLLVLAALLLLYKEMKLLAFDPGFGESLGFPMLRLEVVLMTLLVAVIVVGLQAVGVVLVVATLITPAAAARQWTDRLGPMLLIAAGIGAVSGASGAALSATIPRLPTGPAIVVLASALLLISLFAAPRHGLVQAWLAERRMASKIRLENLLKDLYRADEDRGTVGTPVPLPILMGLRGQSASSLRGAIQASVRAGWARSERSGVALTPSGSDRAAGVVRKHRLWELYLARRLDLPLDHLHRDAEAMEHVLTDETVARLEEVLGHPAVDPHGRPIPPRPR